MSCEHRACEPHGILHTLFGDVGPYRRIVFLLLIVQACRLAPARARAEKMMAARERARKKASLLNDDDDEPEWARDDYFDD